jgi:hypothetical protein
MSFILPQFFSLADKLALSLASRSYGQLIARELIVWNHQSYFSEPTSYQTITLFSCLMLNLLLSISQLQPTDPHSA